MKLIVLALLMAVSTAASANGRCQPSGSDVVDLARSGCLPTQDDLDRTQELKEFYAKAAAEQREKKAAEAKKRNHNHKVCK